MSSAGGNAPPSSRPARHTGHPARVQLLRCGAGPCDSMPCRVQDRSLRPEMPSGIISGPDAERALESTPGPPCARRGRHRELTRCPSGPPGARSRAGVGRRRSRHDRGHGARLGHARACGRGDLALSSTAPRSSRVTLSSEGDGAQGLVTMVSTTAGSWCARWPRPSTTPARHAPAEERRDRPGSMADEEVGVGDAAERGGAEV